VNSADEQQNDKSEAERVCCPKQNLLLQLKGDGQVSETKGHYPIFLQKYLSE
jgi:hypothetical protein